MSTGSSFSAFPAFSSFSGARATPSPSASVAPGPVSAAVDTEAGGAEMNGKVNGKPKKPKLVAMKKMDEEVEEVKEAAPPPAWGMVKPVQAVPVAVAMEEEKVAGAATGKGVDKWDTLFPAQAPNAGVSPRAHTESPRSFSGNWRAGMKPPASSLPPSTQTPKPRPAAHAPAPASGTQKSLSGNWRSGMKPPSSSVPSSERSGSGGGRAGVWGKSSKSKDKGKVSSNPFDVLDWE